MLCLLKYFYSASKTELWYKARTVANDKAIWQKANCTSDYTQ